MKIIISRITVLLALLAITTTFAKADVNLSQSDAVYWGIFEEGLQTDLSRVQTYATDLGKSPVMVMWYIDWRNSGFPLTEARNVYKAGYVPHVVWEPWIGLDEILAGKWDSYLQTFGQSVHDFGHPVMLRFAHEFNGDWYPWNYDNGDMNGTIAAASKWIQTYQYVHDKIVAAGGSNAIWLWSPNVGNGGKNSQDITAYYPGDKYVDWIAVDGYNWGTSQSWSTWQTFTDVFGGTYNKLVSNYPGKPIMLGEFGCSSTGETTNRDKVSWINDLFLQLKNNYPHIKAFTWFNVNKETDWRFNTTAQSKAAFKTGVQDNFVSSDITKLVAITASEQTSSSASSTSSSSSSVATSSSVASSSSSEMSSSSSSIQSSSSSSEKSSAPATSGGGGGKSGGGSVDMWSLLLMLLFVGVSVKATK